MTVRRSDSGAILLEGICPVEDAEPLLELLQSQPAGSVDWQTCERLHTSVLQLLLAAKAKLVGPCGDAFVRRWIEPVCLQG